MLTIKQLKEMEPGIFTYGIGLIEHPWFNNAESVLEGGTLEQDGRSTKVKWVAVRGGMHDWTIYHSMDANFITDDYLDNPCHLKVPTERIARNGAKLCKEEDIKKFVLCDDKAFKMYRY